jgi:hypothetical protein
LRILLFFAYAGIVPNVRSCRVSFTDSEGITHAATVAASSLYEAAALAVAEFRRCGLMDAAPGPATQLAIRVEAPSTMHALPVRKLMSWLDGSRRTPAEQALKERLRGVLARG